ncbi:expressed unknown protein [Seminavis robusta]|uniref:Uncharacterized protein n=1 Tax=Seminavis robusta TaxID=568900 RepID=A0A9N8HD13_9STRA|nr:expressed unknown protein [Seminavis robusta]|eukprot:Sro324_g117591.1  (179) ;mRNA; r:45134-45670
MDDSFESDIPDLIAAETIDQLLQLGEDDLSDTGINNQIQPMVMAEANIYFTDPRDQMIDALNNQVTVLQNRVLQLETTLNNLIQSQQTPNGESTEATENYAPIAPRPTADALLQQQVQIQTIQQQITILQMQQQTMLLAFSSPRGCCLPYIYWLSRRVGRPPHDANCRYRFHGYATMH